MVLLDEFLKDQSRDSKGSRATDERGSCGLTLERTILEIQDAFLKDADNSCFSFLHLILNDNCDLSKTNKKEERQAGNIYFFYKV